MQVNLAVLMRKPERKMNMIHNITRNSAYNYSITYKKTQSKLKDWGGTKALIEKNDADNDADNDVYRNAVTKATMIAEDVRYSQGTFDLSMLIGGGNTNSYFTGKLSSASDVDYFHVDTTSQISRRPVINYKLTFSQGEMPQEVREALKRMQTGTAKLQEGNPEERAALGAVLKAKNDARNAAETEGLHQAQYNALSEELKYKGDSSVEELLKKELRGESITEAERAYIAIYGNQNDIYYVECQKRKQELEQEFAAYLESVGLSGKEFSIYLETGGKAVVSGLDEAQKEQVEDYIEAHWEQFKNIYLTTSKECAEMTDQEYRIAGYVEECNRFLSNVSGRKVSVDDLSIKRKVTGWYINSENIVGLPSVIASVLNSADSTDKYYDYKQMIHSILNYKQEHGEIPQYHMDFKWSGKELKSSLLNLSDCDVAIKRLGYLYCVNLDIVWVSFLHIFYNRYIKKCKCTKNSNGY